MLTSLLSHSLLISLADDDGDGEPDDAVVLAAERAAEAEVRAALASGGFDHTAPFGDAANDIAGALAAERLFAFRRDLALGVWADRIAHARASLAEIAAGRLRLPEIPAARVGDIPESAPLHRIATMGGL